MDAESLTALGGFVAFISSRAARAYVSKMSRSKKYSGERRSEMGL
jgi:hypothetical protein